MEQFYSQPGPDEGKERNGDGWRALQILSNAKEIESDAWIWRSAQASDEINQGRQQRREHEYIL